MSAIWPEIPYDAWRETCAALHLYCQIVGKYRLARTPWVNHSWHATLYVNARALMAFLEGTYRAAADTGRWDRAALECPIGTPLRPRTLNAK